MISRAGIASLSFCINSKFSRTNKEYADCTLELALLLLLLPAVKGPRLSFFFRCAMPCAEKRIVSESIYKPERHCIFSYLPVGRCWTGWRLQYCANSWPDLPLVELRILERQ